MDMDYKDVKILEKREELKKEKYNNLEDGFYIKGKVIKFQLAEITDTCRIKIPDMMKVMPEEYARIKYPSEFRPQIIYTTPDLCVNLGLNDFKMVLEYDHAEDISRRMQDTLKREYPNYRFYESGEAGENGFYFAFRSHALDSDIYNMLFVRELSDGVLQGNFNCLYQDYPEWKRAALLIWESIKETDRREIQI